MFVLGLQGSPRLKGNTSALLSAFLEEAGRLGGRVQRLDVARMNVTPCQECGTCEREDFCPIDDDMQPVFSLLREADIIVMATPVFFYGATAQLKALIDRSQALWSRKYVHKLVDPGRNWRQGVVISVGATRGANLFDGIILTAKYFFDAVGASLQESLTYREIEKAGEIRKHPTALEDAREKAGVLVKPFLDRKKVLFACQDNASLSQMASAFTRYHGGHKIDVESGSLAPAEALDPVMIEVMGDKGIDMAFTKPKTVEEALAHGKPDLIVTVGDDSVCPDIPGVQRSNWHLSSRPGESISLMRELRDSIEERAGALVSQETGAG
jgi:multimeric flavodoxin WrbA/protein-tyrosine-phosphatase